MSNELYCNVIGITDSNLRDNHLHVGSNPTMTISTAAGIDAVELFKGYCDTLGYGSSDFDPEEIEGMIEDGCLYTEDNRIKVFIVWPQVQ